MTSHLDNIAYMYNSVSKNSCFICEEYISIREKTPLI